MISTPPLKLRRDPHFLLRLQNGDEGGLVYFYKKFYPMLSWWALKRVKDDVAASSITHEAFLRLWLLREKIDDGTKLLSLLNQQINQGCNDYYKKVSQRFYRNLIKLDDIENYQEFIGGYEEQDNPDEMDTVYQQELDQEQQQQWAEIETAMPNLPEEQQLFIKLCLRYSFSYDRIAWHLGGISDYEVARRIEKTTESLKHIIVNTKKLDVITKTKTCSFEGELTEEQTDILKMRYEMQYSFGDIAAKLGLSERQIHKTFVQAHATLKKSNKGTN